MKRFLCCPTKTSLVNEIHFIDSSGNSRARGSSHPPSIPHHLEPEIKTTCRTMNAKMMVPEPIGQSFEEIYEHVSVFSTKRFTYGWNGMKCCLSSSSILPVIMSVTSITEENGEEGIRNGHEDCRALQSLRLRPDQEFKTCGFWKLI